VQTAGEGSTGYYVRGGAIDQNLMLLDNATVYNPSHLFGFFSIFNGTVVNSLEMFKSGIPSYYGGRLSSVTKVTTRKGDAEKFRAEGGIGIIATNILFEGPIVKNKGSFLIAARRTYVDFFAQKLHDASILKRDINYYFYDLNVNMDYNITSKDNLSLRSYSGKDKFHYNTSADFTNAITWSNKTLALHWLHNFSDATYSDLSLQGSIYTMRFGAAINDYAFNVNSNIKDMGFTYQFNTAVKKHEISYGFSYIHHAVSPNNINAYSSDVELTVSPHLKLQGVEGAFFINDKIKISDALELSAGMRLSGYSQVGPFTRYLEDENFQILDTIRYKKNYWITKYVNPEPRVAFRYKLDNTSSVKLSYDRTYQYMHMAPLSSVSLPLDIWVPSSAVVKPQFANQYSVGYFRNFLDNLVETSATVYYKDMHNQIEYRQGVIVGYSKGVNYDDNFVFGRGTSYGSEFFIKKSKGKLNGQLAYTLSRTVRKFPDLNNGKTFPAKYDRLHDLSVMMNYVHNSKWTFSTVFVYATGNALNLPVARYIIQGNVVNEYGSRNSYRMPSYHRMDIGITYTLKKSKEFESYLILSVYNVYNRRNPYYIYFETKGNLKNYELSTSIKQVSLFPVIPSITYRFKF
ncbi:MAG TPA: TonB-dependent receptor, partial [Cyclobacteriaceae bacterium]|nr:TonB-dependent receptor [Cyclobacteriaceae bacterium]